MIRLAVFDCDLTLWNHHDASELKQPFVLDGKDSIRDQEGTRVTLFPQVRTCLETLAQQGYRLSVCSWNRPEPVYAMLDLFGLRHYFRHGKVEPHPDKHLMIERMMRAFVAEGLALSNEQVVFTDDRTVHRDDILRYLPGLHFIQMWVDVKDHDAFVAWITAAQEAGRRG